MLKEGTNMPNRASIGILIAVVLANIGCERTLDGKPCPCDPRLTDICCDGICVAKEQCARLSAESQDASGAADQMVDSGRKGPSPNNRHDRDAAQPAKPHDEPSEPDPDAPDTDATVSGVTAASDVTTVSDASAVSDAATGRDAGSAAANDARAMACEVADCEPGQTTQETDDCGACSDETKTRVAVCSDDCRWQWSAWTQCVSQQQCEPGATSTRDVACPCGSGTRQEVQTCSTDSCTWGDWQPAAGSSCNLECCTEVVYCDTPDDLGGIPANRGTWCRQQTAACSQSEVNADCAVSVEQLGCSMHPEVFTEYL
jgi:hypothetical protein